MKLLSIRVENFRSIEELIFPIVELSDGSSCFGLIGVNEAGKTSLLKAISMKDGLYAVSAKDFHDRTKDVVIRFTYEPDEDFAEQYLAEFENNENADRPKEV